jgi:hypothetical protein
MSLEKYDPSFRDLPRILIFGFVAAAVIFTLIGTVWTLQGIIPIFQADLPITLTTYAQLMSAFGTIALTLGLVLLYDQQTEIQRRQEEWMEAEHVPDVFIDSWEIDGDEFEFNMTNLGTGIAKNIEATYEIEPVDPNNETALQGITGVAPLEQNDIFTRVLPRDSETTSRTIQMTGSYDVRLNSVEGSAHNQGESDSYQALRDQLGKLAENIDQVEYTVSIRYDYIRRENDTKSVYGGRAELEDEIDFEGLLLTTAQTFDTDLDVEPSNLEEN